MIKSFVIRKPNDKMSEQFADGCIASAKQFGIIVEKFDGVYDNHDAILNEKGIKCYPKMKEDKKTKGFKGCFLSHYMLWERCLELNEPIMIFEHDALMIRPLPDNILELFTHHCILDHAIHLKNYEETIAYDGSLVVKEYPHIVNEPLGYSKINHTHVRGSHATMVKPLGAKTIIDSVKQYGHLASDATINQYYTSYVTIEPLIARCHPFFSDSKNRQLYSHTK
jgi:GR25 family glycosyltransferase involved in LPS biosynthesis